MVNEKLELRLADYPTDLWNSLSVHRKKNES
jgi:hypothetical protein